MAIDNVFLENSPHVPSMPSMAPNVTRMGEKMLRAQCAHNHLLDKCQLYTYVECECALVHTVFSLLKNRPISIQRMRKHIDRFDSLPRMPRSTFTIDALNRLWMVNAMRPCSARTHCRSRGRRRVRAAALPHNASLLFSWRAQFLCCVSCLSIHRLDHFPINAALLPSIFRIVIDRRRMQAYRLPFKRRDTEKFSAKIECFVWGGKKCTKWKLIEMPIPFKVIFARYNFPFCSIFLLVVFVRHN